MPLFQSPPPVHPGFAAGKWYPTYNGPYGSSVAVPAVDTIYFHPFWLPVSIPLVSLNAKVQTGGVGSSVKMGIWANQPNNNHPVGAPLVSNSAGAATATSATMASAAVSATLPAGFYWAGLKFTGTLPVMFAIPSNEQMLNWFAGSDTSAANSNAITLADAYVNALPTIGAAQVFAGVTSSGVPFMFLGT